MSYLDFRLRLSDYKKEQIRSAAKNGHSVTLQFDPSEIGIGDTLKLTQRQITHLKKAKANGKGARITLSMTQLKQNGGFLNLIGTVLGELIDNNMNLPNLPGARRYMGNGLLLPGTTAAQLGDRRVYKGPRAKISVGGGIPEWFGYTPERGKKAADMFNKLFT